MRITKKQLRQVIKEEITKVMTETLGAHHVGEGAVFVAKGKKEVWDAVQDVLSKSQGYFGPAMMAKYLQELATKVTSSEQLTGFEE